MTYRNAEARLPERFVALPDAERKARRAFVRGCVLGLVVGLALGASVALVIAGGAP